MVKNSSIIPQEMGEQKYFFHQSLYLRLGGMSA